MLISRILPHRELYYFLLFATACVMPFSEILMSIATISISINWILEPDYNYKLHQLRNNRYIWLFLSVILMSIIGLLYTDNFNYASHDLRIKLPLLAFPIVIGSSRKIPREFIHIILYFFILSVLAASIIIYGKFTGYLNSQTIGDGRNSSIFISHIRFSLMICLAIFTTPFLPLFKKYKILYIIPLWFILFLLKTGVMTGIIVSITLIFVLSIYFFLKSSVNHIKITSGIVFSAMFLVCTILFFNLKSTYNKVKIEREFIQNSTHTRKGNLYDNPSNTFFYIDNGNISNELVCKKELFEEWDKKSTIKHDGKGPNGYPIENILIRYLTSKGLTKDAEGVQKLSKKDIQNIENGIPNYLHASSGALSRFHLTMFEIDNYFTGCNPSGNSIAQRLEYVSIGQKVALKNFWFGVGTGDINEALKQEYVLHSKIDEKYMFRSHNQYLTIFICFGVFFFILFLLSLFLPFINAWKNNNLYFIIFIVISSVSFLSEDTLETQPGVTFFAFWLSLLFFNGKNEKTLS